MPTHTRRARAIFGRDATLAMADVPPVTIPTSVPAAFDDVASGGDDLATLLDRAGDILDRPGVPSGSFEGSSSQRATLNAFKGAPSAYQAASDVAFGAPPSAATVASASVSARRDAAEASARVDAVGAELRQLAKSVGANVRLPASSAAVVEAEAAARDAAKVARRAEQLKSYGRRRPESSRAARKAGGFSRSLYAQDRERQAAKRAEIEARAAADRAPFITASHGVRLPAPVTAQPPSAVARREAIRAGVVDAAADATLDARGRRKPPPPPTRPPRPYPGGATPTSPTTSTTPSPCSFRTLGVCPSGRPPLRVGPPPGKAARMVAESIAPSTLRFARGSTRRRRRT